MIGTTVPPYTSATGAQETQRLLLNDLIRASSRYNRVADLAAVPELQDPDDTTYYSDGTHPTAAGAALFASTILAVL